MSVSGGIPGFAGMIWARVERIADQGERARYLEAVVASVWWPGSCARPLRGWNPVGLEDVVAPAVEEVCAALLLVGHAGGDPLLTLPAWRSLGEIAESLSLSRRRGGARAAGFQRVVAEAFASQARTHPFRLLSLEAAQRWTRAEQATGWTVIRVGSGTYPMADFGGLCQLRLPAGHLAGARTQELQNFVARDRSCPALTELPERLEPRRAGVRVGLG